MGLQKIEIKTADGSVSVSVEQFLALPLDQRLKHVLERTARFFVDNQEIPVKDGMRLLRETTATGTLPATPASTGETLALGTFYALPLEERVRLLVQGRLRLHDEQGVEIPLKDALRRANEK